VTIAKTSVQSLEREPRRAALPFSFTGHETFVFRHGWLTKAVSAVMADPTVFNSDDAIVRLGVGKNMVRSIRHWGIATGVLEEVPKSRGGAMSVSELGMFLFGDSGRDRYLEDPGTLWLLHWQLLNHPTKCTTWQWAFGVMPWSEFSRAALTDGLMDVARRTPDREPSESSVRRDVEVFLRTYLPSRASTGPVPEESLDCPLVELELLEESGGVFRFLRGAKQMLPDGVFAFAVTDFWRRNAPTRTALSFSELSYGLGSPGAIFKLDENSLMERLESFTDGALLYADTAGVKQLYRRSTQSSMHYLRKHYRAAPALSLVGI
jgi:hypothetical protein